MKVKGEYYHERLTPEPLKLLGSAENNTTKDKTGQKYASFWNYWIVTNSK